MRNIIIILSFLLLGFYSALAEVRPLVFGEFWNNIAYYETCLQRKNFSSTLGRFEGKLGINLLPFQVYGAYYGVASQDDAYWNNVVYSGFGVRLLPFAQYRGSGWWNEWIKALKFFGESLSAYYLKNENQTTYSPKTDTRYGLDLWYEWNLDTPIESIFWGELWANYSFCQTNFTNDNFKGYILYFQPKIGRHLGKGVEAYLKVDLVTSNKDDYYLNVADYGVGLRFEPWRLTHPADSIMKKFKMFVEVLGVSYLKDKPSKPDEVVSSDVRFGVDFSYGR